MSDADAIRALIQRYLTAYEAHDASGCSSVYSDYATVFSPWSAPAVGTAAIATTHEAWFDEGEHNKVMTLEDLIIDGDLATCLVRYSADVPTEANGVEKTFGVSLNTFRRDESGAWKIKHTSLNEIEAETGFPK